MTGFSAPTGDVTGGDTALGQPFPDVTAGKPRAQVQADRDRDHLPREPEASEHRGRARGSHRTSLQPPTISQRNSAASRWSTVGAGELTGGKGTRLARWK
jgi:hypothetical protein